MLQSETNYMNKRIYEKGEIVQVVEYHSLYPERMLPSIKKVLSRYNRDDLLCMISNLSHKLANKPYYNPFWRGGQEDIDLPRFCFGRCNINALKSAINRFEKLKHRTKSEINYSATIESAILYLMRELMSCQERILKLDERQMEKDIFKCILTANQLSQPSLESNPFIKESEPELYYAAVAFSQYGIADIIYSDIKQVIVAQTILCIKFFEWAEKDEKIKPILDKFCEIYGLGSKWWLYPKSHWIVWAISKGKVGILDFSQIKIPEYETVKNIMRISSIDKDIVVSKSDNIDYKFFRSNPLIKLNNNEFFIYNFTLFIEHIYNSLYFEFNKIASEFFEYTGQDFNKYYTTEFSQNHLLNNSLKDLFSSLYEVVLTETQCIENDKSKDAKNCGAPDFYARTGNIVIIVENKDIRIKDTKREYGTIKDKLDIMKECFVTSPQGRRKGIRQILKNVTRIRSGEFQRRWDPHCPKDAVIYPLIVVGDYKFSHSGLKNFLEYWQIQQKENDSNVRPVVLADIATILLYKTQLKKIGIHRYFEDYYSKTDIHPFIESKKSVDYFNAIASFAAYMRNTESMVLQEYMNKWTEYIKK